MAKLARFSFSPYFVIFGISVAVAVAALYGAPVPDALASRPARDLPQTQCTPAPLTLLENPFPVGCGAGTVLVNNQVINVTDNIMNIDLELICYNDSQFQGASVAVGPFTDPVVDADIGTNMVQYIVVNSSSVGGDDAWDSTNTGLNTFGVKPPYLTAGVYSRTIASWQTNDPYGDFFLKALSPNAGTYDEAELNWSGQMFLLPESCEIADLTPTPTETPTPAQTPLPTATPFLCPPGTQLINGRCWSLACSEDVSCDHAICGGECYDPPAPGYCDAYVQCPDGQTCVGGMCRDLRDPSTDPCLNEDPDLLDSNASWETNGSPLGGWVRLQNGQYLRDPFIATGGYSYRITFRGDNPTPALFRVLDQNYEVTTDMGPWEMTFDLDDTYAGGFEYSPLHISLSPDYDGGDFGYPAVDYMCIEEIETPTPTVSPTPFATSTPPPMLCENLDPSFNVPDQWTAMGATYAWGGWDIQPGGSIQLDNANLLTMQPGRYQVVLYVSSEANGNQLQYSYDGAVQNIVIYWADITKYTVGMFDVSYSDRRLTISTDMDNIGDVRIESICFQYAGGLPTPTGTPGPTDTPGPTPTTDPGATNTPHPTVTITPNPAYTATPGPTPQPGPEPSNDACLNPSANLDGGSWQVAGGARSDGVVTLYPGGKLFDTVDLDDTKAYYINIIARAALAGDSVIVTWHHNRQPVALATEWRNFALLIPRSNANEALAPLRYLDPDPDGGGRAPVPLVSPLDVPSLRAVSPLVVPELRSALGGTTGDVLLVETGGANGGNVEIQSVCVTAVSEGSGIGDMYDVVVYHPTCDRDYRIESAFVGGNVHPFLEIGTPGSAGLPVHAILPGRAIYYGEDTSIALGSRTFDACAIIDHSAITNMPLQSIYCNLREFNIPSSSLVQAGNLIGYTSDDHDGLLVFALRVDDELVNPTSGPGGYLEGYPDCYPWLITFSASGECAAGDGNALIPGQYDEPLPRTINLWSWIRWLALALYDTVGYPILCALSPLFDLVIGAVVQVANAVISSISPVFVFFYRVARLFEYAIATLTALVADIVAVITALSDVQLCGRAILRYFGDAIGATTEATVDVQSLLEEDETMLGVVVVSQLLLNSRVATFILTPMVLAFIGFASWRLIPWVINQVRRSVGLAD